MEGGRGGREIEWGVGGEGLGERKGGWEREGQTERERLLTPPDLNLRNLFQQNTKLVKRTVTNSCLTSALCQNWLTYFFVFAITKKKKKNQKLHTSYSISVSFCEVCIKLG